MSRILEKESGLIDAFAGIYAAKISGRRFRIHGNFHLGRLFVADTGFVVRDFEGDPFMVSSERRLKRSPLRDIASMVNSIHRAAFYALQKQVHVQKKERQFLEPWADSWSAAMSNLFISGYLKEMENSGLLPNTRAETMLLLKLFLIERAVREINSRLRESQKGVFIPLTALDKYLEYVES
jgi:maltose alpha-D-glucosyltransferase/alpha-amylase